MDEHQSTNPESVHGSLSTESQDPARPLFFGVGCWDFGIRCQPSLEFTVEDYVAGLREQLEAIPSLNNLNITTLWDDTEDKITFRHAQKTDDGMAVLAKGVVSRIDFDLYIPFRIQDGLARLRARSDTGTENFRIHVLYVYYSPVVFVELLDPTDPCTPSTAMVVIREYLWSELRKTHDLVFTYVGPTPFHADFRIEPGPVHHDDRTFERTTLDSRAYSSIAFRYRPGSSLTNAQSAFEELVEEIGHELDVYYFLHRTTSENIEAWDEIERLFLDIISHSERTGWWQRMRSARLQSRDIRKLSIRLARFQAEQISDEYAIRKAFYDTYERNIPCYLKPYVEAEMKERPVFPTVPVADLLGFFERRRSKGLELLVIVAAAIVGGVAGSLLTMYTSQ